MSYHLEHFCVRTDDADRVAELVLEYCAMRGLAFEPHAVYRLDGTRQLLAYIENNKRRRKFWIGHPDEGWVFVREVLDYVDFADPAMARWCSDQLGTTVVWLEISEMYNIWCYQVFNSGHTESEAFHPTDYFLGKPIDDCDLESYGYCTDLADTFNQTWNLPHLWTGHSTMKANPSLYRLIKYELK